VFFFFSNKKKHENIKYHSNKLQRQETKFAWPCTPATYQVGEGHCWTIWQRAFA